MAARTALVVVVGVFQGRNSRERNDDIFPGGGPSPTTVDSRSRIAPMTRRSRLLRHRHCPPFSFGQPFSAARVRGMAKSSETLAPIGRRRSCRRRRRCQHRRRPRSFLSFWRPSRRTTFLMMFTLSPSRFSSFLVCPSSKVSQAILTSLTGGGDGCSRAPMGRATPPSQGFITSQQICKHTRHNI